MNAPWRFLFLLLLAAKQPSINCILLYEQSQGQLIDLYISVAVFYSITACGQESKPYQQTATGVEVDIRHAIMGIKKIRLQPVNSNQIIHAYLQ